MRSRRAFLKGLLAAGPVAAVSLAASACSRKPGTGYPGYAFVANSAGRAIAAVDLNAFAVARHVRLDAGPSQIAAPRHRAAVYALTPDTGTVHEIRTETLSVARKVTAGPRASGMQLTPDSSALWVLMPDSRKLVRVGLETLQVDAQIPLPAQPTEFHVSSSGEMAAVSFGSDGFALVDLRQSRCGEVTRAGGTIGQVRFQFNGRSVIAANLDQRLLSLYDVATGRLIAHLPVSVRPERMCFNSDGGQLFVTGEGLDGVVIVAPYQAYVSETILAGHAPGEMAAISEPPFLFIASPKTGDVSILNIATRRVMTPVSVGTEPCYITTTPDDELVLVLNKTSGDMAVLRVGAITAKRREPTPLFTMIPVGSEPVSAVVRAV